MLLLLCEDYSLTFQPLPIARYSWGVNGENENTQASVAKGIRTQALSIESSAFYRRDTTLHITPYNLQFNCG